jgi:hypothetical protein
MATWAPIAHPPPPPGGRCGRHRKERPRARQSRDIGRESQGFRPGRVWVGLGARAPQARAVGGTDRRGAVPRPRPWIERLLTRDPARTPHHGVHMRALRRPSRLPGIMPCHTDVDWLCRARMLSEPSVARLRGRANAHGRRAHTWHERPRRTTGSRSARDSHVWPRAHPASRTRRSA